MENKVKIQSLIGISVYNKNQLPETPATKIDDLKGIGFDLLAKVKIINK